ncbi:MAG: T9SS type A sorting domain-containing protein, partial [Ferruginibacter sp.]|nr:T9SS type A sorting domain-containing protein [Ferruginibacter sp.]
VNGSGYDYQWQISTNGGTTYTDITGAQSINYSINSVNAGMNNNRYRLNIRNNCTSINTNAATLKINTPPSISVQPSDIIACVNDNKSFTVSASGSTLEYQWQVSTDGGNTFNNISAAKASNISLNSILLSQNNERYRVIVSGSCPSAITSNSATLTVNSLPVITANASKSLVCTGTPVTLTANGASTYSWSPVSQNGSSINVTPKVNPSSPSVALDNVYTVTGTDANKCSSVKTIKVTAKPIPVVTLFATPSNTSMFPGKTVELRYTSSPSTGYSFIWKKNGAVIQNPSNNLIVGLDDIGTYTVEAIDATDNCNGVSSALVVKDSITQKLFIYPNPNEGKFNISYFNTNVGSSGKQQTVTIYDSHGARVYNKTFVVLNGYQVQNISMPSLSSGVYLVVINDVNGERLYAERILIKHQ